MNAQPALSVRQRRGPIRAVALVLHGGRDASLSPTSPRQLSVLRMIPFVRALIRAGAADGLAVARLRFAVRGWNGEIRSPVADVRWALEQLGARFPGAPVVLVGHSMGGRAALYAAAEPSVAAVVALAPWIERGDPVEQLAGRRLLIIHGNHDRTTSARGSAAYARLAREAGATVSFVSVEDDAHAMLRRPRVWHRLAAGYTVGVLFGTVPNGTSNDITANVVAETLAGAGSLVV